MQTVCKIKNVDLLTYHWCKQRVSPDLHTTENGDFIMGLDARDPSNIDLSFLRSCCKFRAVWAQVSLPWRWAERAHLSNNFPRTVRDMCLELLELSPGSTTSCYNGKRATATSAKHVTKITEAGFNIKQSSIYIYLCDCSAINRTSLSTTPWANIVWVCNNSALDTGAPPMHPESALRELDFIQRSNIAPTDSTWKCTKNYVFLKT